MLAILASTAVSAATLGSRSLSVGTRGADVAQLQELLTNNGHSPGLIDGIFGSKTQQAVLAYQRTVGLPVVGVVGPLTTARLLSSTMHSVQRGESLYLIARKYGTTVDALRRSNSLQSDLILVGQSIAVPRGQAPVTPAAPPSTRAKLTSNERDLLARIVHAESQGEPFSGMVAVAAVVFNRVESSQFPNTVSGVIHQPYQFEPVLNGWVNKSAGQDAYRAIDAALAGQDPSAGALFFYNPVKASHQWMASRPVLARIGNHVFLK